MKTSMPALRYCEHSIGAHVWIGANTSKYSATRSWLANSTNFRGSNANFKANSKLAARQLHGSAMADVNILSPGYTQRLL